MPVKNRNLEEFKNQLKKKKNPGCLFPEERFEGSQNAPFCKSNQSLKKDTEVRLASCLMTNQIRKRFSVQNLNLGNSGESCFIWILVVACVALHI